VQAARLELDLDFAGDVFRAAHFRRHRAAHQRNARARPLAEPVTVDAVMLCGGTEIPEDRLVVLRQQGEAADLVLRPCADVRGRDVAHVVHVEAEDRAQLRIRQQLLDACEALSTQPVEVDPALPVDRHRSVSSNCHLMLPRRLVVG
jgi:hypothetical protein